MNPDDGPELFIPAAVTPTLPGVAAAPHSQRHGLTVMGRDPYDNSVWLTIDADTFPLHPTTLTRMHRELERAPITKRMGHALDEQDITELLKVAAHGPDLEPCAHCDEPAPFEGAGEWLCPSHADALGDAENASDEAVRDA